MALNRMNFSNASLGKQLLLLLLLFVMAIGLQSTLTFLYSSFTNYDEQKGITEFYTAVDEFIESMDTDAVDSAHLKIVQESKKMGNSVPSEIKQYFLIMQMGYNILCFLVVGIVFRWFMNKEKGVYPDLNVRNPFLFLVAIFLLLASIPLLSQSIQLNEYLGLNTFLDSLGLDVQKNGLKQMLLTYSVFSPSGGLDHLIMFLGIAVFPAIGEELFFRGGMQKQLHEKGIDPHWAIFFTALVFSLLHMEFLAFFYRFLLGVILGYVYFWSKSIWPSIIIHFCNNALTYFSLFLISSEELTNDADGGSITFTQLLMSVFSTGFLLFIFYQTYRRNQLEDSI